MDGSNSTARDQLEVMSSISSSSSSIYTSSNEDDQAVSTLPQAPIPPVQVQGLTANDGAIGVLNGNINVYVGPGTTQSNYVSLNRVISQVVNEYGTRTRIPVGNVVETSMNVTRIIPRSAWLARPPIRTPDTYPSPANKIIVIHSATRGSDSQDECCRLVKSFQENHVREKKLIDIKYNFLIGGDGNIYEGRGWDKVGEHTQEHNIGSLGVAFIGNFMEKLPSKSQLDAFQWLIDRGLATGKIAKDYILYAHCQLQATNSPGRTLFYNVHLAPLRLYAALDFILFLIIVKKQS